MLNKETHITHTGDPDLQALHMQYPDHRHIYIYILEMGN